MGFGPSRQMRDGTNFGERPVMFKLADAERIAQTVASVEGARRGRRGSTLPRAAGGGGGGGIFTASFAGSWMKNTDKILYVSGSTAAVSNISSNILYSTVSRMCFVTMIDSRYVLLTSACE